MMRTIKILALAIMAVSVVGCAITDYDGLAGHKTSAEAKLMDSGIAFSGFGADLDGTYEYTVKYNNRNLAAGEHATVTINSYRNTVFSSFSRDGVVNRDGDSVQGHGGDEGGKYLPQFVAVDTAFGSQFGDNITQDKSVQGAGAFLSITGALEETDDIDTSLNLAVSSLDGLLSSIWSGALTGDFDLTVNGITLAGVSHPIAGVTVGLTAGALRPSNLSITNQASVSGLIQTILDNTNHLEPVSLGLSFDGGLSLDLPSNVQVAFDHGLLTSLL